LLSCHCLPGESVSLSYLRRSRMQHTILLHSLHSGRGGRSRRRCCYCVRHFVIFGGVAPRFSILKSRTRCSENNLSRYLSIRYSGAALSRPRLSTSVPVGQLMDLSRLDVPQKGSDNSYQIN
jgi:hypothetical protein